MAQSTPSPLYLLGNIRTPQQSNTDFARKQDYFGNLPPHEVLISPLSGLGGIGPRLLSSSDLPTSWNPIAVGVGTGAVTPPDGYVNVVLGYRIGNVALNFSMLAGNVAIGQLPVIPANTVLVNATGGAAAPTAYAMPTCGTGNFLVWSAGTGFICTSAGIGSLAGDVTGPLGSNVIGANAVGNSKLAQVPGLTIKGNNLGSTGNVLDLTATQVAAMLTPGGDVGGTIAATVIQPHAVSNTKLAQMAAFTMKGNNTNALADPLDLTRAQVASFLAGYVAVYATLTCDGVTDNTTALDNLFWNGGTGPANKALILLPTGICAYSDTKVGSHAGAALAVPGNTGLTNSAEQFAIIGAANYSSELLYTGATTNVDLLRIGNAPAADAKANTELTITGFRIDSNTTMTAGAALHLYHVTHSRVDPIIGGQNGNGGFFRGYWCDECDNVVVPYVDIAGASADNFLCNGSRAAEAWWPTYTCEVRIGRGKISPTNAQVGAVSYPATGIHLAGGVGGFSVEAVDVIGNQTNLLVDQAITSTGNQSAVFGPETYFDTAESSYNVLINDNSLATQWQGGSKVIDIRGWIAGAPAATACAYVQNFDGGLVNFTGFAIGGCVDGLKIGNTTAKINVSSSEKIYNNTGYGIDATVANLALSVEAGATFTNNTLGSLNPNAAGAFGATGRPVPNAYYKAISNASSIGTTQFELVTTDASGNAVTPLITDTDNVEGVTISATATTGYALIATTGVAPCQFDGTPTSGDWVINSSSSRGKCHDTGSATRPTSGQAIGRVLNNTGAPTGTYLVSLSLGLTNSVSGALVSATFPLVVTGTNLACQFCQALIQSQFGVPP